MKKMAIGWLALALSVAGVYACYESGSAPETVKSQGKAKNREGSGIIDRAVWKGGVVMPDGAEMVLINKGGIFQSIELTPKIQCAMWVSGAGLVPGREVTLTTMNGGLINGKVMDRVAVGDDAFLRFEYSNGARGAQPIQATIFGDMATLVTVKVAEMSESATKEGAVNENR